MVHEYGLIKITHAMALVLVLIFGASDVDAADDDASFYRFWPDNLFSVEFVIGDIGDHSGTVLRTIDGGTKTPDGRVEKLVPFDQVHFDRFF